MIGIVGYGMGNVRSVVNALDHIGAPNMVAASPEELDAADKVLLPGVGAFGRAMDLLEETGFRAALDERVRARGKPLLGICLGMQLLADTGTEFGERQGLGYIPGRVEVIPRTSADLRLPHMGWNDLSVTGDCPLLEGIDGDLSAYFVHGFQLNAARDTDVSATCDYGGPITAAVSSDGVYGMQFHPEKSQALGLKILANFAAL